MEFVDVVLILMYVAFAVAIASVLWSAYRRSRKGRGRLAVQNGIHAHRLNSIVWLVLFAIFLVGRLVGGSLVDMMLVALLSMFVLTIVAVCWSVLRKK